MNKLKKIFVFNFHVFIPVLHCTIDSKPGLLLVHTNVYNRLKSNDNQNFLARNLCDVKRGPWDSQEISKIYGQL